MKKARTLIFLFFLANVSFAQDTTEILFSEENGMLVKQRFIDRYENIFMTKIPTRHMVNGHGYEPWSKL